MYKFEVGKTYSAHSICDYDCVFEYEVIKRTAKTATLKSKSGEIFTRRISIDSYNDSEEIYPEGKYSFAPRIVAGRKTKLIVVKNTLKIYYNERHVANYWKYGDEFNWEFLRTPNSAYFQGYKNKSCIQRELEKYDLNMAEIVKKFKHIIDN